ncbi:MAG TPA: zinc ribbon domain-containing protein, partial [Pyrinomonadaceae bacterium]|nr:zinc ribbon domain-containing protein [Pyrinomonadaceae bacterium]
MITCDRCKTENLDGSQYCDECGAPLRPNGRAASRNTVYGHEGQNGSHAAAPGPHPEFAGGGGRVSAGLNLPGLRNGPKPHARLVIERGRSSGKQFMLSEVEAQIGRWDADGGIFPDVDLVTDD